MDIKDLKVGMIVESGEAVDIKIGNAMMIKSAVIFE